MTKVGYIGLGDMGKPIAINQAKAGFELIVFDTRKEPLDELRALGARIATSPKDVGANAEIVGLSLRDDEQLESVVFAENGLLNGLQPGSSITIHTTCHPDTARKIRDRAKDKGVGVLDAPVSNGSVGAWNAALCFMVGGDLEVFQRCRHVFEASGKDIIHVGDLGNGLLVKLAHQVITVGTLTAVAEGMLLAEAAGVDLAVFSEVLRHCSARSNFADQWLERVKDLKADSIAVMCESVDPAMKLAETLNVALPLTQHAQILLPARVPVNQPAPRSHTDRPKPAVA